MVPVPMARRLVLMPVLPRVTVSAAENFAGSGWDARAARICFEVSFFAVNHVSPRAVVERMRNSRRCIETPGASGALDMRLHQKAYRGERPCGGCGERRLFELFAEGGELLLHLVHFPS